MKPIIVQKYGGTSVSDTERIQTVAQKVVDTEAKGYHVVVVVSAMGSTTDELLELARRINPSPNQRELDMLLTVGERISMALLSMAIHALGRESISFTGSQSGIITNDAQGSARIIEVRPYRVQDELARGRIVIVAGYQGVSYKREVTTLGRGGSDTTAVALAAALNAEACEIYSDVDGVYSADPRVVVEANQLQQISYEEMQEMARFGAKVLNADAVEFARKSGIAVYAKATSGGGKGTVITRPDGFPERQIDAALPRVRGVTGRRDVLLAEYQCPPSGDNRSREVLAELSSHELLFASARSRRHRLIALISTENAADVPGLAKQLRTRYPDVLGVRTEQGLVTLVGDGIGIRTEFAERMLDTLDKQNIEHLFTFTGRSTVSAVVDAQDVDRATQVLHEAFLGA